MHACMHACRNTQTSYAVGMLKPLCSRRCCSGAAHFKVGRLSVSYGMDTLLLNSLLWLSRNPNPKV